MGEAFGEWLKQELARRGWSQTELARQVGTSTGTVSDWVRGVRTPTPESCDRIADVLVMDVDDVLTRAGHRPPEWKDDAPDVRELIALARALTPIHRAEVLSFARWRLERLEQTR